MDRGAWQATVHRVANSQTRLSNFTFLFLSCSLFLFSNQVVSHSLWLHGLQHTRLLCPPLSPGVCPSSCPLNQWCHPTISSSVTLLSCPQSFPASGSFPMSQLFTSGGQSIRASASVSVLPMNIQGWFPLGLSGLISLQSKGLQESSSHHSLKASILRHSAFFMAQLSHPYMTIGKTIVLTRRTFVGKVMSLFLIHFLGLS